VTTQEMHDALDQLWKSLDAIVVNLETSATNPDPRPDLTPYQMGAYRGMTRAGSAIIEARKALKCQLTRESNTKTQTQTQ